MTAGGRLRVRFTRSITSAVLRKAIRCLGVLYATEADTGEMPLFPSTNLTKVLPMKPLRHRDDKSSKETNK